jgi:hypothetical protein
VIIRILFYFYLFLALGDGNQPAQDLQVLKGPITRSEVQKLQLLIQEAKIEDTNIKTGLQVEFRWLNLIEGCLVEGSSNVGQN